MKTLEETLRKNLEYLDLTEDMCSRIHIANPTRWGKGFVVVVVIQVYQGFDSQGKDGFM